MAQHKKKTIWDSWPVKILFVLLVLLGLYLLLTPETYINRQNYLTVDYALGLFFAAVGIFIAVAAVGWGYVIWKLHRDAQKHLWPILILSAILMLAVLVVLPFVVDHSYKTFIVGPKLMELVSICEFRIENSGRRGPTRYILEGFSEDGHRISVEAKESVYKSIKENSPTAFECIKSPVKVFYENVNNVVVYTE